MLTIYKYPLLMLAEHFYEMPKDAQILTVQVQRGRPCLWALVNTDNALEKRKISIRGTGYPSAGLGRYISTFQMDDRDLVFHAFETE